MPDTIKKRLPLLVMLANLVVTGFIVSIAYFVQQSYSSVLFNNLATRQTLLIQQYIDNDIHLIGSSANFMRSTSLQGQENFHFFAEKILQDSESLIGLQWLRRVDKKDYPAYVEMMRIRYPNFYLYTQMDNNVILPGYHLNDRPMYVVDNIYPHTATNRSLLGFYSSHPRFQKILSMILISKQPGVSDKIRLLKDDQREFSTHDGLLIYYPVFDLQNETLSGMVVGVIRLSTYVKRLIKATVSSELFMMRVIDKGLDNDTDSLLYSSPNWRDEGRMKVSRVINLPNREWVVEFHLPEALTSNDRWVLFGLGSGGVIISLLLGVVTLLLTREKAVLNEMLEKRTAELKFLVEHDSLTGIYNRRAFNRLFPLYIRDKKAFSLVSFDIDYFKQINDNYSHLAGDKILLDVVQVVKTHLNIKDVFVRTGGDEFVILCSITDNVSLYEYLEQLRQLIEKSQFEYNGHEITLSLSIGAVVNNAYTEQELLQKVDAQVYKSKARGRNSVSIEE
ncbi:sensor domain-containing diguanylate cyclase [Vibrio cincinnatiensis]|uniref:sensor domain-containing diguanylate cyclase n=1 Tax=Vibrio cincinnatiensis TaxID=675 RepID=UPI0012ACC9A5|nr:sensor domain-containing diguanylate cyclase [Vibrio cincinnatiensis]MCG3742669.1 sensor domain-containing diguanylate cyclase [Vibrio cincinnatiensis]